MTKTLLAAFVLAGSAFFVGCADGATVPTADDRGSSRDSSPSSKKQDDSKTTATTGATTTPDRVPTEATTTPAAKTTPPADVVVKPIDPVKPEPPQIPAFACKTDEDSVTASYKIALLRAPDPAGLSYWVLQIQGGQERVEVLRNMVRSDEFVNNRAVLSDAQFVNSLYTGFLARQPDGDGKQYWLEQLASGASRTDVAIAFIDSDEFADPKNNQQAGCYF